MSGYDKYRYGRGEEEDHYRRVRQQSASSRGEDGHKVRRYSQSPRSKANFRRENDKVFRSSDLIELDGSEDEVTKRDWKYEKSENRY